MGLLRITLTLLTLLLLSPLLQAETSNVSGDPPITSHNATPDAVEREHITHEHHAGRADFDDDIPKPYKASTRHDNAAGAYAALSHNTHNDNAPNDDTELALYLLILACAVIVLKPTSPSL